MSRLNEIRRQQARLRAAASVFALEQMQRGLPDAVIVSQIVEQTEAMDGGPLSMHEAVLVVDSTRTYFYSDFMIRTGRLQERHYLAGWPRWLIAIFENEQHRKGRLAWDRFVWIGHFIVNEVSAVLPQQRTAQLVDLMQRARTLTYDLFVETTELASQNNMTWCFWDVASDFSEEVLDRLAALLNITEGWLQAVGIFQRAKRDVIAARYGLSLWLVSA